MSKVAQPLLPISKRLGVQRVRAEIYVLITLVAFAASVIVTRVYLELTGYPQIGSGNLHIAHVLWGGLGLYIAALLPLIFLNRSALVWSAILNGVGVGLFIDEVGKFITKNVDYFYPPAAPIIYAFFLLSVLLYFLVRRPAQKNARNELFRAIEEFPALLDGVLLEQEMQAMGERLTYARQSADPKLAALATTLTNYLVNERVALTKSSPGFVQRLRERAARWGHQLGRRRHRKIILWLVGLQGAWAVVNLAILAVFIAVPSLLSKPLGQALVTDDELRSVADRPWFLTRLGLQLAIGLIALQAFVLLWRGREEAGIRTALFGLTLSLTTVVLLTFYLNQFSAIATALIQFALFFLMASYRQWYLMRTPAPAIKQE